MLIISITINIPIATEKIFETTNQINIYTPN